MPGSVAHSENFALREQCALLSLSAMQAEEKYFTRLDSILGSARLCNDSLDLFVLIDKKRQLKWIEMDDAPLVYSNTSSSPSLMGYTIRSMSLSNIDKESMIVSLHHANLGNETLLFIVTKSSVEEESMNGAKFYHIHTYMASKEHYVEAADHSEEKNDNEVYLDVAFTALQSLNMDYCPLSITIDSHLSSNKGPVLLVTGSDNTLHAYDVSLSTMKVNRGLSREVYKSYWEDRLGIGHMKAATNMVLSNEVSSSSKSSNTAGVMQTHSLRGSMSKVMSVKYPQVGHAPMVTPTVPLHFLIDNRNPNLIVSEEGEKRVPNSILETNQGMIGYTSGLLIWSRSVVDTSDEKSSVSEDNVLNRKERYSRMSLMMDGAITCVCLLNKTSSPTPNANLYSHAVVGLAHGAAIIDLESVNINAVMIEEALGHGILKCLTVGTVQSNFGNNSGDSSCNGGYEDIFMGFEDGTVICLSQERPSSTSGQDDVKSSLESDVAPVSEHLRLMLETISKETTSREEADDNSDMNDDDGDNDNDNDNDDGGNEKGGSSEDDVDEEEADDFFVSDIGLNDMAPPAGVSNRSTESLLSEDSDTLPEKTTVEGLARDANDSRDSTLKRTNTSVHSQEKLKFKESWRADFPFPVIGMALSEHIQYPTLSLEQEHSQQVLTVVTTKTVHCLHLKKI